MDNFYHNNNGKDIKDYPDSIRWELITNPERNNRQGWQWLFHIHCPKGESGLAGAFQYKYGYVGSKYICRNCETKVPDEVITYIRLLFG
jgi:hypothetical protein